MYTVHSIIIHKTLLMDIPTPHNTRTTRVMLWLLGLLTITLIMFVGAKFVNEVRRSKFVGQDITPQTTITVSADGETTVTPDNAELTIGIAEEAKTAEEAQQKSAVKNNVIMTALRSAGIEEKDIKTTSYNVSPMYDYSANGARALRGYTANQDVRVKIRDVGKAGSILTDATKAGANTVSGPDFTLDTATREAAQRTARQDAITKAQEKAHQLAHDLDVSLVRLVNFSESGDTRSIAPSYLTMAEKTDTGGGIAPELPSGENTITTSVTLTYEIH